MPGVPVGEGSARPLLLLFVPVGLLLALAAAAARRPGGRTSAPGASAYGTPPQYGQPPYVPPPGYGPPQYGLWLAFLMVVLAVFGVLGAAVFRDWPPVARPRAPPSAVAW